MTENIKEYAKLGLVHHLLYPQCITDMEHHAYTLAEFAKRCDIEAFDCCLPYDPALRESLIPSIRSSEKNVAYAMHLFPLRKLSLSAVDIQEQGAARILMADQIQMAARVGAKGFVFVSGADVPQARGAARKAFKEFCRWFCTQLKPHGITALLEPFDRTIDKKFLYGPINDCVELMDELTEEHDNIGIELDMAHLPLMFEDFDSSIKRCGKHLKRIHLGNCVLKDKNHPLYGDKHPPIGLKGGEIFQEQLVVILTSLLEVGYLSKDNRKPLIMEMTPFPEKPVEYTIEKSLEQLAAAWEMI